MSLKKEIIARFKEKFKSVNLSSQRLEAIADKIDGKIEKEDEIDAKLDDLNEVLDFAEIARLDDVERASKKKKPVVEEKEKKEEEENEPDKKDEEAVPKWAQAMMTEISSLKSEKVVTNRKSLAAEKFKDAPEAFRNDLLADLDQLSFKDDDEFASYLERKEKTAADLHQNSSDQGLGNDKPFGGVSSGKDGEKEVSPLMKSYLANQAKAKEAKAQ